MNKSVFFLSATAALLLLPAPLFLIDLRAADPLPPTPPGSSLPPPASSTPAPAAPSATPAPTTPKRKGKHAGDRRFQKLKQELALTPDQIAQIKPIMKKASEDAKALRANTSLPEAQKRKNLRQIFAASFQQIKPLLTPEQLQKWKQIRAERHHKQSTPSGAKT